MSRGGISSLRVTAIAVTVLGAWAFSSCQPLDESREVENLRAFGKLYGYVRFFHPSDEASEIDWAKFAVHGSARVKSAASTEELASTLAELFLPIAPTVQIYPTGSAPEPVRLAPEDTSGFKVVAWQHLGVGLTSESVYKSQRLNRPPPRWVGPRFGTVTQGVDAIAYRGKRIRLRAFVRTEVSGGGNQGHLWLRVDRASGGVGFFDNMGDRPITSSEWAVYEIKGEVAEDAGRILFGGLLAGRGRIWLSEFQLLVEDGSGDWESIEIANPGFEDGDADTAPQGWGAANPGYRYRVVAAGPSAGARAVLIEDKPVSFPGPLFEGQPELGEAVEAELGAGLSCRVPLALLGDSVATWPRESSQALESLTAALESVMLDELTADDESVRLADIIIAWNIFQHFYPYFDVVGVDWDAQLTSSLQKALADSTAKEFYFTLSSMVAALRDGHGNVYHSEFTPQGWLPFVVSLIEERVVVTYSEEDTTFRQGDVIESIDGVEARQAIIEAEEYISGSPQWKRFRAERQFGAGDVGTRASLVVRRGSMRLPVRARRQAESQPRYARPDLNITPLGEGIYYINLSTAEVAEIDEMIEELAAARGVIFDLRGYPNGNHKIISHLLASPDTSGAWMRVPQIIYPDQRDLVGFRNFGWNMPALEPRLTGKIVFVTDGRAISYAESFMGFIEHYKLGEIVGGPTAGTNGNVNPFNLPGGFRIVWTGMKVVKHDGSQHHLIGIQPTVPAQPSLEVAIGQRDELLNIALDIVSQGE